jgi:hypothetical protein
MQNQEYPHGAEPGDGYSTAINIEIVDCVTARKIRPQTSNYGFR